MAPSQHSFFICCKVHNDHHIQYPFFARSSFGPNIGKLLLCLFWIRSPMIVGIMMKVHLEDLISAMFRWLNASLKVW